MQWHKEEWVTSACASTFIAGACLSLSLFGVPWLIVVFVPGAHLAALICPDGIYGESPVAWMVLAFVFTVLLFMLLGFSVQQWWPDRKNLTS